MPNKDKTGPAGAGQLTGRGLGPCAEGLDFRRGYGFDRGCGFGRGRGFRRWGFQNVGNVEFQKPLELTKEQQKKILEAELAELEVEKKVIKEKIQEIK